MEETSFASSSRILLRKTEDFFVANDEFSTDIDITLTPILGGYEITLTADEEWLNDEARVYPVVIDPIYIYGDHENESNIIDTMVHDDESTEDCLCGVDHDTSGIITTNLKNGIPYYSFFKFIFPDTLAAGRINSASVNLHLTSTTNSGGPFKLCRVLEDWDQSTISYNDMPSCDKDNPIANNVSYVVTGTEVTAEFNVTQWARDFTAGILPNYGFMLAYADETINDYNRFHTVDYTTVSWRPQVEVNYSTYWPGSGETHYINNYGSHKFLQAEQENSLYVANTEIYDTEETNTGLNWTVTPLDNYVSYFGISFGAYHLRDTGTQINLYYDSNPPTTVSTVPESFQWHIFEYTDGSKTYQVIKNRATGRFLSVSGNTIVGVSANTGEHQQWYVGYVPCKSIEIENRVAVAGEVIDFEDLGVNYNGSGADPSLADDYSFCDATVSPSTAATVEDEKITISPNFTGGQITVTFERADTDATDVFSIWVSEYPGTYFIKNVESGMYMDTSNESGRIHIKQYGFDGEASQKWQFEIQTDGSYMIKNVKEGTYLTIAGFSVSGGYPAILSGKSAEIIENQRFYIEKDSNGNVTIYPQHGEATNAILGAQTTSSGAYIGEGSATADDRDKWQIRTGNVYVEFSMDQGYVTRNQRENESREETAERISDVIIYDYFDYVRDAFAEQCGVYLELADDEVRLYTSAADNCPTDTGIDGNCQCIANDDCAKKDNPVSHCKNMTLLLYNLENNMPINTIRVTYIGHTICYTEDEHGYNTIWGLGSQTSPIAAIRGTNVQEHSTSTEGRNSVLLLVHELSHVFGAPDHEATNQSCVMSDAVFNRTDHNDNSSYWCDSCKATISSNFNKY